MQEKNSKNHHYLPQFYIKSFTDENEMLWCFDIKSYLECRSYTNKPYSNFIRKKSPSAICYIKDDNTFFDEDGNKLGDMPEQVFSQHESMYAELFTKMIEYKGDDFPLKGKSFRVMYMFFLSLLYRNPNTREHLIKMYREFFKPYVELSPKAKDFNKNDLEYLNKINSLMNRFCLPIDLILTYEDKVSKGHSDRVFENTHLFQLYKSEEFEFLSSDSPVFLTEINIENGLFERYFVPLNPKKIVCNNLKLTTIPPICVNLLSIANANRFIFAKTKKSLEKSLDVYFNLMANPEFQGLDKSQLRNKLLDTFFKCDDLSMNQLFTTTKNTDL